MASYSASPSQNTGKYHLFIQVAMLLAVITGIEIILVYIPFPRWMLVTILATLSAVKFGFVIFAFMHLRWDKIFCTILFLLGLVLATFVIWALLKLFGSEASRPLETVLIPLLQTRGLA